MNSFRGCLVSAGAGKIFLVWMTLLVMLLPQGLAAGKKKPQEIAKENKHPESTEPDHLIPLAPLKSDGYGAYVERLMEVFQLRDDAAPRMLVRPTLRAEYVLRLLDEKASPERGRTDLWVLSCGMADTNIWYSKAENNSAKVEKPVSVTTQKAVIPATLGRRLQGLWSKMLQRTQKDEGSRTGSGGITYEFSMGGKSGKISAPQERRSPRLFVELGESLVSYCQTPEADRAVVLASIQEKTAALEEYLQVRAVK